MDKSIAIWQKYPKEIMDQRLEFTKQRLRPLKEGIGRNCTIGPEVKIGKGCEIRNNVVILGRVTIGDHCLIRTGAVIGEDGFSVERDGERILRVVHTGEVVIGNHVDIGCYTVINRATVNRTTIGDYTKISHRVTIGHNNHIGKRVIINLGTLLAGSVIVKDDVFIGYQATVKGKLTIHEGALVGMCSWVTKDVPPEVIVVGRPAKFLRRVEDGYHERR